MEQYGADATHKPKPTSFVKYYIEYRKNHKRHVARNNTTLEANDVLPKFKCDRMDGNGRGAKVCVELRTNLQ